MTPDRVMLLIDADNVSVDVVEQAVAHLLDAHGALHVRRAYCTAESALKHQAVFRRLSIKPMVNLSTGKNSTDIALAVDAVDLVLAERPDVVAIASSDSDFAPLVARLREKGCRVVGIGQEGKTGEETLQVYDEFTVLAHRKARAAASARPARKTSTRATAKKTAGAVDRPTGEGGGEPPAAAPVKTAARKSGSRRKAASAAVAAPVPPVPEKVQQMLALLPELARGDTLELRVASVRLREAGLLSGRGSSTRLFGEFPDRFELLPTGNPNHVRLLAPGSAVAQGPAPRGFGRGAST
ncbi:MAG: NYN domain-containing protein [Rubrivivax sp.]|nr:NYN domain-containing protein [Rubrivivax sp.]